MNDSFQVSSSYDALADEYVAPIYHELEYKPLDREWLDLGSSAGSLMRDVIG